MHKLKKAVAVAAMVGSIGLVGGGIAHADGGPGYQGGGHGHDGGGYGHDGPSSFIDNLQVVECEQTFDGGTAFTGPVAGTGDANSNIGNFCTTVGSIGD